MCKVKISQNFAAFSEYMDFKKLNEQVPIWNGQKGIRIFTKKSASECVLVTDSCPISANLNKQITLVSNNKSCLKIPRSSTYCLPGFFWLLNHVIYLKLTIFLYECILSQSWVLMLLKYYSVTVTHGKTFVLYSCALYIDSTQLFSTYKSPRWNICHG